MNDPADPFSPVSLVMDPAEREQLPEITAITVHTVGVSFDLPDPKRLVRTLVSHHARFRLISIFGGLLHF